MEKGLPPDRVRVTGFPVNPGLGALARERPVSLEGGRAVPGALFCPAFRTACARGAGGHAGGGPLRHASLASWAAGSGAFTPISGICAPDTGIGWPCAAGRRVPSYLAASHVVVGKAGGATVHEGAGVCTAHAGKLSSSGPGGGQRPPAGKTGRRPPCGRPCPWPPPCGRWLRKAVRRGGAHAWHW